MPLRRGFHDVPADDPSTSRTDRRVHRCNRDVEDDDLLAGRGGGVHRRIVACLLCKDHL